MIDGMATVVNPAYRFGAQRPDNLGAADDLKRSLTNEAAAVNAPINRPSRDHLVQMCYLFRFGDEERLQAMAEADRGGAYK